MSSRTNGDGFLLVNDWFQEGRFVAGLDLISNANEFQRLDCAPRGTSGMGRLPWLIGCRWGAMRRKWTPLCLLAGRRLRFQDCRLLLPPARRSVSCLWRHPAQPIRFWCSSTRKGMKTLLAPASPLTRTSCNFLQANLGAGASAAFLNVNSNQAASGLLGFALALSPGATFSAGLDSLVRLDFAAVAYGSNNTLIAFGDSPVLRSMANANADALGPVFENATLAVSGLSFPTLGIARSGTNVVLSWLGSPGLALATASSLTGTWTSVSVVFRDQRRPHFHLCPNLDQTGLLSPRQTVNGFCLGSAGD